jgi:hypothetical protein
MSEEKETVMSMTTRRSLHILWEQAHGLNGSGTLNCEHLFDFYWIIALLSIYS